MVTSLASRTRSVDAASRPTSQASAANLDGDLIVPNRSSSLHSRTTQQLPTAQHRNAPKVPKTLTHAYMVCGVGREPAQWIQAPSPAQGKITHMRNAVGQYWLPEILGSSPRLEQDNEIAQSLHSAMRVRLPIVSILHRLISTGMLPPRRRDMHGQEPATLRSSRLCTATRLITHALRHRPSRMVTSRRQTSRDHPRDA